MIPVESMRGGASRDVMVRVGVGGDGSMNCDELISCGKDLVGTCCIAIRA